MAYVGTPIDTQNQFQSLQGKRFSGNASTTAFTLDIAPSSVFDIEVFVENVRQDPNSAYGISGTTLTFTGAPPSGTNNIYVVHQAKAVGTIDVPASGVVPASLASNIISGQTELAATPADTDELLISDAGTIKRIDFSHIKGQGKIGQVLSTTKTDTFSGSAGGGAYVDVTGLSVAITPSATSSKILVMATLCGCNSVNTTSPQNSIGFKIIRGSTDIAIGDASSSRSRVGVIYSDPSADQRNITAISLQHLDSPSSTSEQTYKIAITQGFSNGAVTLYVNRTDGDPDDYSGMRAASSITVLEVLA